MQCCPSCGSTDIVAIESGEEIEKLECENCGCMWEENDEGKTDIINEGEMID